MLPFIGYHIADYIEHWLKMGKLTSKDICRSFSASAGFANPRMESIFGRVSAKTAAFSNGGFETRRNDEGSPTPVGIIPAPGELDRRIEIDREVIDQLFGVDKNAWKAEIALIEEHYKIYGDLLPEPLAVHLLKQRVGI